MSGIAIEMERVFKIYRIGDTDVQALGGLDLHVEAGEMVGIIGPSGCGKTTLLNMIGTLLHPTTGKVLIDGVDLTEMKPAEVDRFRRKTVGFIWQDTARNLVSYLDALGNVALPLILDGQSRPLGRARHLLELVGLGDRMRHLPSQLSGGQQQRVAIAVALANEPSLLLADEPTGALDGETAEEVYSLIRRINRELGVTVVIVSHDPNMARVVDRVVEMRDGQSAMEHVGDFGEGGDSFVLLVDTVGRVRVPDEYREELGITERVIARVEGERLILEKGDRRARMERDHVD